MATGDGFEVDPPALTAHGFAVDRIAETVDLARRAGERVRLGAGAYGQLCQLLPASLHPLQGNAVTALAAGTQALHDCGHALRMTADAYTATDHAAVRRISGARYQ